MNRPPPDPKRGYPDQPGDAALAPEARSNERRSERRVPTVVSRSEEDDARSSSKYRAALEALFAAKTKKPDPTEPPPPERSSVKMIKVAAREDPRRDEREKRLGKLLGAEGRAEVTKAADDFVSAGFELPASQDVMLQLLDHDQEDRVRDALAALDRLMDDEPPQRRPLLDARLRRLEGDADDAGLRALATTLRRKIASRR